VGHTRDTDRRHPWVNTGSSRQLNGLVDGWLQRRPAGPETNRLALLRQRFGVRVPGGAPPTSQVIPRPRWVVLVRARAWASSAWVASSAGSLRPSHSSTEPWTPPHPGPLLEAASVAAIDVNRGPPRVRAAAAATVIMATTSASVRSTRRARCRYATDQRRRRSGPRTRARSSGDGRVHRWRVLREPGTGRMGVGGTAGPVCQWCEGADDEPAHGDHGRARSSEGPRRSS
jgi:hypothetical protein